jgi:hypothetical protein
MAHPVLLAMVKGECTHGCGRTRESNPWRPGHFDPSSRDAKLAVCQGMRNALGRLAAGSPLLLARGGGPWQEEMTRIVEEMTRIVEERTRIVEEMTRIVEEMTRIVEEMTRIVEEMTRIVEEMTRIVQTGRD